jgi:hypothetical protein
MHYSAEERHARRAKVKELHDSGMSLDDMATALSVGKATITSDCKSLGLTRLNKANREWTTWRRREKVLALHEAGFTLAQIAAALPMSPDTIWRDFEALGLSGQITPSTPFSERLKRFAWSSAPGQPAVQSDLVRFSFPEVAGIKSFLAGSAAAMRQLLSPGCPDQQRNYIAFLKALFEVPEETDQPRQAETVWNDYLSEVRENRANPAESLATLQELLCSRLVDRYRLLIMPLWPDAVFGEIEAALSTQSVQTHRILDARFGLTGATLSLEAIGDELACSKENVRQIEMRAMANLRNSRAGEALRRFIQPVGNALIVWFEEKRLADLADCAMDSNQASEDERVAAERAALRKLILFLNEPIPFNWLSVRNRECLEANGIKNYGQLAQKTEAELLRTKNFARKSLKELVRLLEAKGLRLGMKLETVDGLLVPV